MKLSRVLAGLFFIGAGINHFVAPRAYLQIMPPALPAPMALIYLSGLAEIAGGAGLLLRPTRKLATWGLLALLIAIFPANIYGLQHGMEIRGQQVPTWLLWFRLPFQPLMMWWVWNAGQDSHD